MNLVKGRANDKIYDIISEQEYLSNMDKYNENRSNIAIQRDGYLYPLSNNTLRPGLCVPNKSPIGIYVQPEEDEKEKYAAVGDNLIDFNDVNSRLDMIKKSNSLRELERKILCSPDNITTLPIGEHDTPAMYALKTSVNKKKLDIDKYQDRFSSTFNNDKRVLTKDDISLKKLVMFGDGLDMKMTLIIEDKNPNVANPMNDKVIVELTSRVDDIFEEEQ